MRRYHLLFLVFVGALLVASACFPARRVVLIEEVTNAGCGCARGLDPGLDSLLAWHGHESVVCIRYNGWWPWPYDQLYLDNPAEIEARVNYYGITAMPSVVIDGEVLPRICDAIPVPAICEERIGVPSPLKVVAVDSRDADSFYVNVTVIAEEDPQADSLALRVAVVEDSIYYEAPNTLNYHDHTFRTMLPDTDGTVFSITPGETLYFDLSVGLDPAWDAGRISAVVLVQNDGDLSVVQAASSRPRRDTWAGYYGVDRGDILISGRSSGFPTTFTNLGSLRDTFDIDFVTELPGDWSSYYDIAGADVIGDAVALDPDSSCVLTVNFDCGFDSGTGEAILTLASGRDPEVARSLDFFAISGVCGLLVDDDGGDTLERFYEDALDSAGVVYGVWRRDAARLDSADMALADFTVWFTGQTVPTLDESDQEALAAYLDSGGRLCLTGQDIGYSLCDPTSSRYSLDAKAFFETYVHAAYVMPNSNLFDLTGRSGDAVSDGISLTIRGGDGADNQDFPDVVDAISPAEVIFDYSDPAKHGGVKFEGGSTRLVYLSFGFEAIDNEPDRVLLMSRIIDWLGPAASVGPGRPGDIVIACYPNPAVAFANISVSGSGGWQALRIYDVQGRLVRDAGGSESRNFLWDLRDEEGAPVSPGVYFVSLSAGASKALHKLMIVR